MAAGHLARANPYVCILNVCISNSTLSYRHRDNIRGRRIEEVLSHESSRYARRAARRLFERACPRQSCSAVAEPALAAATAGTQHRHPAISLAVESDS